MSKIRVAVKISSLDDPRRKRTLCVVVNKLSVHQFANQIHTFLLSFDVEKDTARAKHR